MISTLLPPCRHRVAVASGRHQSLPTKVATSRSDEASRHRQNFLKPTFSGKFSDRHLGCFWFDFFPIAIDRNSWLWLLVENFLIPTFMTLTSSWDPMLLELGLPSSSLHQTIWRWLPFSISEVGFLSLPQKGFKIGASSHFLEVQVPVPAASAADSGEGGGGGRVGRWVEKRVCEEENEKETPWNRCESFDCYCVA